MKYKVLLTGNSDSIIDTFFQQMENNFEALTTSVRYADVVRHINCFTPDVFVVCLNNEPRDHMVQMNGVKPKLAHEGIPVVLIGTKEECEEFRKIAVNAADLVLYRPLSAENIQESIFKFLGEKKSHRENEAEGSASPAENIPAGNMAARQTGGAPSWQKNYQAQGSEEPQRKHVLVVDDNSMMLRLVKEHLHDKYDVATAVSGKIALKFLQKKKTDLILLDYEMPDENGPAVLEKLRASNATKDIPVVFLTGVTESKKIREALAMKPQSYLLKPINRDRLLETIEKIIG